MGEPTSFLGFFLSAAVAFGKLLGWLSNENRKSRERVATYFDQIAACMRDVAERIEAGDPPRDTCRRLAVYASELQTFLGNREYLIAAGDASIEATRWRLFREIEHTNYYCGWVLQEGQRNAAALAAGNAIKEIEAVTAKSESNRRLTESEEFEIERLADGYAAELSSYEDARMTVQQIWDAAGDFAALADALRAR